MKMNEQKGKNVENNEYWVNKLSDKTMEVNLPIDYKRTGKYVMGNYSLNLPENDASKLLEVCNYNQLSLSVFLLTCINISINKLTGEKDIIIASPVPKEIKPDSNCLVPINSHVDSQLSFKELLFNVRQTVTEAYQNCEVDFESIKSTINVNSDFSFTRMVLINQNISRDFCIENIQKEAKNDLLIYVATENNNVKLDAVYNAELFKESTIVKILDCILKVFNQVISDVNIQIRNIEIISEHDKKLILENYNNTSAKYDQDKPVHVLFEEQVSENPDKVAVSCIVDLQSILDDLKKDETSQSIINEYNKCVFQKNKYIFEKRIEFRNNPTGLSEDIEAFMIKTHHYRDSIVNKNVLVLLKLLNGRNNLETVYNYICDQKLEFVIYSLVPDSPIEILYSFENDGQESIIVDNFNSFVGLIKRMYRNNLVEIKGKYTGESKLLNVELNQFDTNPFIPQKHQIQNIFQPRTDLQKADVLLFGDTLGTATVGLLYIASYLMRNGIKAYCQFQDFNAQPKIFRKNIYNLLDKIQPKYVGVSMKWFPNMQRALEICKVIKEYSVDIKVIIGGNSGSYYAQDVIKDENVDYVVRGDGELPFLKICQNEKLEDIPNLVYKKDNQIFENPWSYVQNETNSSDIYLSHLDDILISKVSPFLSFFFVYLYKGCLVNCFYCAGSKDGLQKTFNRPKLFWRGIEQVRNDIIQVKEYTSTFMFDFEDDNESLLEYCHKIWDGIDLKDHFLSFTNLYAPSPELIEYINKTFKFVYWTFDMCSLSERHRKELEALKVTKPQPTDQEIFDTFDEFDKYENNEARFNLIAGLPKFTTEDIVESERMIDVLIHKYNCLAELHWGRLHAQPGAALTDDAPIYDMKSYATKYEDFIRFSELNLKEEIYPCMATYKYPYIFFNDNSMNAQVSKHYVRANEMVSKHQLNERKLYTTEFFTYADLNKMSNQLARELRKNGIKKDETVGLILNRSIEMIVGILGVLKAGGAYLPIDPKLPLDRVQYLLENSKTRVVLVQPENEIALNDYLLINIADSNIYQNDSSNLENINRIDDLMYVIYTSGSTGKPKGVKVCHRGIINYINWRKNEYNLNQNDITLQPLSYSFDGFGSNLYSSLLSQGELYLPNEEKFRDYGFLGKLIEREEITCISLVPSMYKAILENSKNSKLSSLKYVVLAGEKVDNELIEMSRSLYPSIELINEYGPTENSVTATALKGITVENSSSIGKPIANNQVYIVNQDNNLMPIGFCGEICLSGDSLSRGYIDDQLTNQKFVENPFIDGQKMYKTGDQGKWLNNGEIEFLGRIDNQVKISGYRIELSEIENVLLGHTDVKEATVAVCEKLNSQILVAFYVSNNPGKQLDLKEYMSNKLPSYMVPNRIIEISSIPYNDNGKIDKISLLQNMEDDDSTNEDFIAPSNEIEKRIAAVWENVLGVKNIGLQSNFFDMGGNSFNALTVVSQVDGLFELQDIFDYPVLGELAQTINDRLKEENSNDFVNVVSEVAVVSEKDVQPEINQSKKVTYIFIPYGGGTSIVYQPLVKAMEKISNEHNSIVLDLPGHDYGKRIANFKSVEETVDEFIFYQKEKLISGPIVIYGHCGTGVSIGLELAYRLERLNLDLKALCIGSGVPVIASSSQWDDIKKEFNKGTDQQIFDNIIKTGFEAEVTPEQKDFVVKCIRHDGIITIDFLNKIENKENGKFKVKCPIYAVYGDNDPAISNPVEVYKRYFEFADQVEMKMLHNAGHYYISSHADELAKLLKSIHD